VPLPDRVRLVVLFGGRSAEHDISRVSASHVLQAIDPDRYEVVPVGITRDGRWVVAEAAAELIADGRQAQLPAQIDVAGSDVDPLPTVGHRPFDAGTTDSDIPTVVLPILHGPNGEDGTVQGLLEMAGVPYVGSGVLGSAVSMDKAMTKTVLHSCGIPQPRWRSVRPTDLTDRPSIIQELIGVLGRDLFVKPANMGSSIGVSKVTGTEELVEALRLAFRFDDVAVVEEAVDARELECAVLGNTAPRASTVGEIIPGADFYDYADKYAAGIARIVIPADLDDEVTEQAREMALAAFAALRCEGMARVDLFYGIGGSGLNGGDGPRLMVNEVNTIPGFTPISMYPMLWEHSGIAYPQLVDELVALALERHVRRSGFSTDHSTP
jgi:D-alanine-D-alanine ligase